MKYFNLPENRGEGLDYNWECRTLPFDRDLIGNKRDETNRLQNTIVKNISETMTAK